MRIPRWLFVTVLLFVSPSVTAAAKQYRAERFDVHVEVEPSGDLHVTETLVLRFDEGPFTRVFREIDARKTDGIGEIVASIDGRPLLEAGRDGRVEVSTRGARTRIVWHIEPTAHATKTFTLSYVARGVASRQGDADLLAWRALPDDHAYTIDASRVEIVGVRRPSAPQLRTKRVGAHEVTTTSQAVIVTAEKIGRDGWIEVSLRYPAGTLIAQPPAWQARQLERARLVPLAVGAAAAIGLVGLVLVLLFYRAYPAPERFDIPSGGVDALPDELPPAIAAAIVNGGAPSRQHAMGTVFDLASRGAIDIEEGPRGMLGGRRFIVRRRPAGARALRHPHERVLIDALFGAGSDQIELTKIGTRLAHAHDWRHAVTSELHQASLVDESREEGRQRLMHLGFGFLLASGLSLPVILAIGVTPWWLLVTLALGLLSLVAFIVGAGLERLSDEGFRKRARWHAFRKQLKAQLTKGTLAPNAVERYLPYAVALGLGPQWVAWLKRHGRQAAMPPWFHAVGGSDDGSAALVAMMSASGGSDGGASASAGGAAGGGSSGAD
jgi:Predicted membrane protein (DUF2207)